MLVPFTSRPRSWGRSVLLAAALLVPIALPAHADDAAAGTEIHLVQRAEMELPRDRIHADLRVEAEAADAAQVQGEINRRMAAALKLAQAEAAVTATSGGYSVFQEEGHGGGGGWRGSQTLSLAGKDFAAALKLVGALQASGLALSDLRFDLAPETLRGAEHELTVRALAGLRARAEEIAAAMGLAVARYKHLDVGNAVAQQFVARPMAARTGGSAIASAPPPVAEAGDATVWLQVDADVVLLSRGN